MLTVPTIVSCHQSPHSRLTNRTSSGCHPARGLTGLRYLHVERHRATPSEKTDPGGADQNTND